MSETLSARLKRRELFFELGMFERELKEKEQETFEACVKVTCRFCGGTDESGEWSQIVVVNEWHHWAHRAKDDSAWMLCWASEIHSAFPEHSEKMNAKAGAPKETDAKSITPQD